jgi:hypothetical protein
MKMKKLINLIVGIGLSCFIFGMFMRAYMDNVHYLVGLVMGLIGFVGILILIFYASQDKGVKEDEN